LCLNNSRIVTEFKTPFRYFAAAKLIPVAHI
jgi:hypothetical protein